MALTSTIYRFQLKISNVDTATYMDRELSVAMHPSESLPYLLTRIIAYALNYDRDLEMTAGIASPDEPAIQLKDLTGVRKLWIDLGNPSAKRLHKARKTVEAVRVYTYKDVTGWLKELAGEEIHAKNSIEIFSLSSAFLGELGNALDRNNTWEILHINGELTITARGVTVTGEVTPHPLGE